MKKKISVYLDDETHAWLRQEAKAQRRTIGNQMVIEILNAAKKPTPKRKEKLS